MTSMMNGDSIRDVCAAITFLRANFSTHRNRHAGINPDRLADDLQKAVEKTRPLAVGFAWVEEPLEYPAIADLISSQISDFPNIEYRRVGSVLLKPCAPYAFEILDEALGVVAGQVLTEWRLLIRPQAFKVSQ
jgi:hypothetical protein